ncbi:MAG: deoxyribonuclease IV [Candidatus Kerfeldbacteria bacterium]|nr:deoxyribonuclease IV [Candidatus Kerfeldbacteria bacterium]
MHLGAHVSIAGGIPNAPERAAALGCEVFQIFSRSPRGGHPPALTKTVRAEFRGAMAKHRQQGFAIHTPYYINFASTTPRIRYGSISVVREELERGALLGADAVITHLGSTKDAGEELGFRKCWRSIQRILDGYTGSTTLLLEISAGAGDLLGGSFEELASLIKQVESRAPYRNRVGVCLDTCHVFAAGYDLRTKTAVDATLERFDRVVGLKRLQALHANDSKFGLGEHRDRHEHIGNGQIGREGFRAIVNHPKLKGLSMYLETEPEGMQSDLVTLKSLRK